MDRIIGPSQFKFRRNYIYINDYEDRNDRYETPGYRSFTDIQIIEIFPLKGMWIQLGEKLRQIPQYLQEYKLSLNLLTS